MVRCRVISMKQSQLFSKTRREDPSNEEARNARLLIRGGFIQKEMAGVYSFLPLGLRVLNKIIGIIREEMNTLPSTELFLSALQDPLVWGKTDRWSDKNVDIWFKTAFRAGGEVGLAFTHEEPLTNLMRDHIRSHRDLPIYVYQFQTKFRNETRARSGLIRTREFIMKDLYSFSKDKESHDVFYEKMKEVYKRIFKKAGLGDRTHLTYASGGSFSKYSHEFQTVCKSGEDAIHVCGECKAAVNDEVLPDLGKCPECGNDKLVRENAVEVGNIFTLGTKFSEALGLNYVTEEGGKKAVFMGSYGIGPGRLMGVVAELLGDDKGLRWPASVSPFDIHLVLLGKGEEEKLSAEKIYNELTGRGFDVLFDDRDASAGEKFADADLIGIPARIVASARTVRENVYEYRARFDSEAVKVSFEEIIKELKAEK